MSRAKTVTINREKMKMLIKTAGISQRQLAENIGLRNPQSLNNALHVGKISERFAELIGKELYCWPEYFTDQLIKDGIPEQLDFPRPYVAHIKRKGLLSIDQIAWQLLSFIGADTTDFATDEIKELRENLVKDAVEFYTSKCRGMA